MAHSAHPTLPCFYFMQGLLFFGIIDLVQFNSSFCREDPKTHPFPRFLPALKSMSLKKPLIGLVFHWNSPIGPCPWLWLHQPSQLSLFLILAAISCSFGMSNGLRESCKEQIFVLGSFIMKMMAVNFSGKRKKKQLELIREDQVCQTGTWLFFFLCK